MKCPRIIVRDCLFVYNDVEHHICHILCEAGGVGGWAPSKAEIDDSGPKGVETIKAIEVPLQSRR